MNLDPRTPDGSRNRSILKIVTGLVAAGVVLGLLTWILGAGAMRAIGFKPEQTQPPASPTAPSSAPTATESTGTTASPSQTAEDEAAQHKDKKDKKDKKKNTKQPKLNASPSQVSTGERINLTGSFPSLKEGAVLQVQRREGGSWADFPVVARTNADGSFETWVVSGRSGKTKFRLKAQDSNKKTPPATVQIS